MNAIWLSLAIIFAITIGTQCEQPPCNYFATAELNNGTYLGHTFNKSELYIGENGEERACVCLNGRRCIRKCCPFGLYYNLTTKECVEFTSPNYTDPLVAYQDDVQANYVFLFGRMTCDPEKERRYLMYPNIPDFNLTKDGMLYLNVDDPPRTFTYDASKYCIDTFVSDTEGPHLNALYCYVLTKENDNKYIMSSSCMLISCFFILLTVAVYGGLPELRNLHGMVLIAHLLCLFVGFLILATMQILILFEEMTQEMCVVLTFFVYFFLLAAFFWLNVMCYDIRWTFSCKRGRGGNGSQNKKFGYYSIYAFGGPTILTILLAALEFSNFHPNGLIMPNLRTQGCFLTGSSKILYFYGPIFILCVANLIFFTMTAMRIAKSKKESKMLRGSESSTHDANRKHTQRFTVYVKLFIVMGISWMLEVISYLVPQADAVWWVTDAYNVLIGLIIFIIFVCKKNTWIMIKKRFNADSTLSLKTVGTTDGDRSLRKKDSANIN
ncbi:G-protein coupled receptor Mth2-like isoform X2 [Spodoptera frugiperda]|uniref:G-protein coupled receptor Mth2-like isoform X2 n=1 Tax=Spodoptera frugiperda TaxID=7108 RepID=A0A9R0ELF2_SPOFR|nr:G-protein coupled receptor Mth2-like isoform X2 [Spodoptera frugiperda]